MEDKKLCERLKFAVSRGDVTAARRLIKGGVNVNSKFWYDSSLLQEVIAQNNLPLFKLLLTAGANVNVSNKDGRTPLHTAVRSGNKAIVEELIRNNADVGATTQDGRTCLHIAAWREYEDIMKNLLDAGCPVHAQDEDGWTVLHWVANLKSSEIVERILQKGACINVLNKKGCTPFYQCVANGNIEMCKLLLRHGANPFNTPTIMSKKCNPFSLHKSSLQDVHCDGLTALLYAVGYKETFLKSTDYKIKEKCIYSETNPEEILCQVFKLSELCRIKIRNQLRTVCMDRTIVKSIDLLPLPNTVKDYVRLDIL